MTAPYILRLDGGITIHRYAEIRAAFAEAEASGEAVLVDVRDVPHADSVFLSELLMLRRRMAATGRRFAVVIADGHVLRVLTLARLTEKLELFPDEATALAHLAGGTASPAQGHEQGEMPLSPG